MGNAKYRKLQLNLIIALFGAFILPPEVTPITARDPSPVRSYGYVHWETTGVTDGIVVHRKKIPIQFRADCDALALRAFRALKWEVLATNSRGRNIFLVGQLYPERKFTPRCEACASSEEYQEFRLIDWYITTPFKVARWPENQLPIAAQMNIRKELQPSDFDEFDGKDTMDVRRFQRKVKTTINRASNKRFQRLKRNVRW